MNLKDLFSSSTFANAFLPRQTGGGQRVKHVGWIAGRTDGNAKGHRRELIVTTDIEKAETHRIPGMPARTAPIRVYRKVWKDNGRKTKRFDAAQSAGN